MHALSVIWYTRKEGESDIIRVKSWSWPRHQNISILSLLLIFPISRFCFLILRTRRFFSSHALHPPRLYFQFFLRFSIFFSSCCFATRTWTLFHHESHEGNRFSVSSSDQPLNLFLWWHDKHWYAFPLRHPDSRFSRQTKNRFCQQHHR